ncbi:hypothetical protein [Arthrobacter sp. TMS1-12-1]
MLGDDRITLHDASYRYAFRRSLSTRLASSAAQEAVESVEMDPTGRDSDPEAARVAVLRATRTALERYLPSTLPPRVTGDSRLQAALADLAPADRELLLLHHWDGLPVEDAARMAAREPGRLPAVEAVCALTVLGGGSAAGGGTTGATAGNGTADDATTGDTAAGPAGAMPGIAAFAAALAAADPAEAVTGEDLARSRRSLVGTGARETPPAGGQRPTAPTRTAAATAPAGVTGVTAVTAARAAPTASEPPAHDDRPRRQPRWPGRRAQAILGTLCLLAVVAGLAVALIPRADPGPAGDVERLFALADVVAVVAVGSVEPTQVAGELRMLQPASVVQIVKGGAEGTTLMIDVTGRSTLERPYSRELFPPDRILFLVRDGDGVLSPIEGEGSVLMLVDRRSPETTTIAGDPAPLPDELRGAIDALPAEELPLDTSGAPAGSLAAESVVGTRPAEGRNVQNLPADRLGTFHVLRSGAGGDRACVVFEYNSRSVLLRWPDGFSAYEREEVLSYPDEDPQRGRQVLTVLNERGYPYVDESRRAPFISGTPTGGRGECGGQDLEIWDIAVAPGTTLLSY